MEFSHHFAWSSKYRIEKGILGRHMKLSKTQADFRIWHNFIDFFLLPFHISAAKLAFLPTAIRMMADSVLPIQFGCLALREIKCGKCWAKNKRIFSISGNSYRTHCYWLIKWIWIWFMGKWAYEPSNWKRRQSKENDFNLCKYSSKTIFFVWWMDFHLNERNGPWRNTLIE